MMAVIGLILRHLQIPPADLLNAPLPFLTLLIRQCCAAEGKPIGPSLEVKDFQTWLQTSGTTLDDNRAITHYFESQRWTSKQS